VLRTCLALLMVLLGWSPVARACGIAVGGAPGISGCSLEEHEEAVRKRWHLGSSYAFTSTGLRFSDERRYTEERHVSLVSLDYRPARRATLSLGAGAFLGGQLASGGVQAAFSPGFVGVLGGSWRFWDQGRVGPFALLTGQLSYAATRVMDAPYNAFDLRAGVVLGTSLWRAVTPYLAARAFGGPVLWHQAGASLTGTDTHHYQLGAGLTVLLWRRLDLFAEGVPVGERGLVTGAGLSF
jgi:hypothetical protein